MNFLFYSLIFFKVKIVSALRNAMFSCIKDFRMYYIAIFISDVNKTIRFKFNYRIFFNIVA